MLNALGNIFLIELKLRMRHWQEGLYPLCFFCLVILLFTLTFSQHVNLLRTLLPGVLWVSALLSSLLAVHHVFLADIEDNHNDLLLLSPIPLFFILLVKIFALWIITCLPLILLTPLIAGMYQTSFNTTCTLLITLLLGTPILILLGSMVALLTLREKQQSVLLGILVLPLTIPVLLLSMTIIEQQLSQQNIAGPLGFLAALLILTILLIPLALSAVFRFSVGD